MAAGCDFWSEPHRACRNALRSLTAQGSPFSSDRLTIRPDVVSRHALTASSVSVPIGYAINAFQTWLPKDI